MSTPLMRAVRYDRYGPPEVMGVREIPRPVPGVGEGLVRVHATGVNAVEARVRAGGLRVLTGRGFPRPVGADFAGRIAEIGPGGDPGLVGRAVWGALDPLKSGATQEYLAVGADSYAEAPSGLDLVEAAALPTAGITAELMLDTVNLREGERALVVGASGGVGNAALQLAAARGAHVAAVCGCVNLDFCREWGAAEAYAHEDGLDADPFDAILDVHGTGLRSLRRRLRPGGRIVTVAAKGIGAVVASALTPGPRIAMVQTRTTRARLERLTELVERGELRPAVDRVYDMEGLPEAHAAIATGHSRGKRVIRVASEES
ncbi:NAD(P)-dependent alcohol dehydrogenase [Glycomyces paridis]|uniref:NAD(P)-dependent alcohol dehydrogenase n=1 Tax=Glycomyces paridis TaxID=2126555 RepID=UPI0013050B72|nr:NAD(P)-dependent alcohol dehydrogenase [Glycomyces paridis]